MKKNEKKLTSKDISISIYQYIYIYLYISIYKN